MPTAGRHLQSWSVTDWEALETGPAPLALALSALTICLGGALLQARAWLAGPWILAAILLGLSSLVWNFGVPLAYRQHRLRRDPRAFAGLRTVTDYASGIVGDAILVPILNVAVLALLRQSPPPDGTPLVAVALAMGVLITVVLHTLQARLGWVNWSMPLPNRWSFPGQWHMVSAPLQFSFAFYGLGDLLLHRDAVIDHPQAALLGLVIGIAFICTALADWLDPLRGLAQLRARGALDGRLAALARLTR